MLRTFVRRTTLLQRAVAHARAVRLARRHPEGLVPPAPRHVVVEPTNACNLACAYCGNKDMARPKAFLDRAVYARLLDQMVELEIGGVTLHTIGEPLLHPELPDMVAMARARGRAVSLSTNGSLFDEERTRALVDAGPDALNVSADAADPELLARTRGGLELDVLLDGLRRLVRLREERGVFADALRGTLRLPSISLTCVITPHFTRAAERELFAVFGPLVDDFHFQWPNNHANYVHDDSLWRRSLLPPRWRDALYRRVREPCHYPWDTLFLLADGSMSVCRFDFDARVVVGRFPERSLRELWHSGAMESLRRAHMSFRYRDWEQCRSCSATFYDNRAEHWWISQKLKRRNGWVAKRDCWAPPG